MPYRSVQGKAGTLNPSIPFTGIASLRSPYLTLHPQLISASQINQWGEGVLFHPDQSFSLVGVATQTPMASPTRARVTSPRQGRHGPGAAAASTAAEEACAELQPPSLGSQAHHRRAQGVHPHFLMEGMHWGAESHKPWDSEGKPWLLVGNLRKIWEVFCCL